MQYLDQVFAQTQDLANTEPAKTNPSGQIYGLPELPLPSTSNLKHRYDPVIHQVTNLLMQDGKLSVAQRVRSSVSLSFASLRASLEAQLKPKILIPYL